MQHFNLRPPQNGLFAPPPTYFGEKRVTPIVLNFEVAPIKFGQEIAEEKPGAINVPFLSHAPSRLVVGTRGIGFSHA